MVPGPRVEKTLKMTASVSSPGQNCAASAIARRTRRGSDHRSLIAYMPNSSMDAPPAAEDKRAYTLGRRNAKKRIPV